MKKHTLLRAAALALTAVLSVLAVIPLQHAETDRSDWMAKLDDSLPLNALSLPGTHDSGALHSIADVSGKCPLHTKNTPCLKGRGPRSGEGIQSKKASLA